MKRAITLLLLTAIPVGATPRSPMAQHFWKSGRWWAGEAVIALSVALDAHSTCQAVGRGIDTSITFPGARPCAETAGISLGAFAFYTGLHAAEWHFGHDDPNRVIRGLTPWMVPAAVAPIHLYAAVHNYELPAPKQFRVVSHIRTGPLMPPSN